MLPLLLLLLSAAPAPAAAQAEGNPPHWCRNGAFPSDSDSFSLGWVKGRRGQRVYFHKDDDACPQRTAKCRERAYVVPGDEVVVSRTFGDWACAWYQPARGPERVGWIEARHLEFPTLLLDGTPSMRLVGEWTDGENFINLGPGQSAGRLRVEGQAYWHGLNNNVHVGELNGEAVLTDNVFNYEDGDDCRVTAQLVVSYLVVRDNKRCGGVNVTFDGVYRKKPSRRTRKN
jgi:hypothetical protein